MVRASVVVLAVALLFAFASTARADYEAGASAFQSGDYVNALAAWRPLAEEGNARAQFGIAVIFEEGGGVARDFAQAICFARTLHGKSYLCGKEHSSHQADKYLEVAVKSGCC